MAKFYVDDMNDGTTGPYASIDEAMEDAAESLKAYRANARLDGWGLEGGDLCIFSLPDDFDPDEEEIREGKLVAKNVEFDRREVPVDEVAYVGYDYTCDMRMELVP